MAAGNAHRHVSRPELPVLEAPVHEVSVVDGRLLLERVRLDLDGHPSLWPGRMEISESDIRGLTIEPGSMPGLRLIDVALEKCDLSNLDGREGSLTRVEIGNSKLVGFSLSGGRAQDLRATDCLLSLATFAFAGLRDVMFERVNLREVSFLDARLENVAFVDCQLEGADFRGARLKNCSMRGNSLDGVIGVDSLKGLTMSWSDAVSSAAALAAAIGITIDES